MEIADFPIKTSIILLILLLALSQLINKNTVEDTDFIDSPKDYVENLKKLVEEHTVVTEDGYVLTIHRIPGGPNSKPVFIQHGIAVSSMVWLIPAGRGLASMLANAGYDVWIGNVRGNNFGRKHLTLSPSDPQFWNFTFHEIGIYDLPAVIKYIKKAKQDENVKIDYIGHSMGVSVFTVMASERPEQMKNIKSLIALAPGVFVNDVKGLFGYVSGYRKQIKAISEYFGAQTVFPRGWILDKFAELCTITLFRNSICADIAFWINGYNPQQLNYTLVPVLWSIAPAGTSLKLFDHGLQQTNNTEFQQYDYGPEGNQIAYGSSTPPLYDFSKITVPVALFYSDNDYLVRPKEALKFYEKVQRKIGVYKIEDENFNHVDFMWAKNAPEVLFKRILTLLRTQG